ncbi:MAG: Hsp20/alpha crystallin family protein [Ignavibacteriales bacterium]|nr:Hsp20/alpha crystallin family protein [Ignavibacteriales bacterium]
MLFKKETSEANAGTVRTVRPSVDIQELPTAYVLRLDMPGTVKDAIKAQVNERVLTLSGKVPAYFKQDAALIFDDSLPTEYQREFTLADNIDTQSVDAAYELGVLTVTLKKKEQYLSKEIAVQ